MAQVRDQRGSARVDDGASLGLHARLALGGVAHKPWRSSAAETVLRGERADASAFARAAEILLRGAKGYGHNNFKIGLAQRAIMRTLSQAARGTPQSVSDKKIR